MAHNSARASAFGIPAEEIEAIKTGTYEDNQTMSEQDKVALRWADAVTSYSAPSRDELFEQLQEWYDSPAIVELTMLIAYRNMVNRFVDAIGVDLDQGAGSAGSVLEELGIESDASGTVGPEEGRNRLRRLDSDRTRS